MDEDQERVAVPTWRAFNVAPVARVIMERHRDGVPGVALIERDLVPALNVFVPAATALRMFDATRVVMLERHDKNLEELRRRTRFWLTYVRMDLPGYAATEMEGSPSKADIAIDRARKLVDLTGNYEGGAAPHYLAQMAAEMGPLHERSVHDRAAALDNVTEQQTLQRNVRKALLPVSEALVTLRVLLRNALGNTHADVRALDLDPPAKRKKSEDKAKDKEAAKANAETNAPGS